MWQLILFRGIQGLGAGALFPISLAVIGDLFTPGRARPVPGPLRCRLRRRRSSSGPGLGGFLTDNVSWHWVFYVNIPIGIVSLYVIWRLLPNDQATRTRAELRLSSGGVALHGRDRPLLVGLTNKSPRPRTGWTDPRSAA